MDTSAQTQDTRERMARAALDQLLHEGRITVDGVGERTGIKGRQTLQNHMDEVREVVLKRNRILLDAADAEDFPIEAFHECARWALTHAQTQLADREAALDAEADQLRQARADFKAEQEDLRQANKLATQRAEESERRLTKAEQNHKAAVEAWDGERNDLSRKLDDALSKQSELEGQREADREELERLGTENKALAVRAAQVDEAEAEVARLVQAADGAKADYARLEDRMVDLKIRLADTEKAHQQREAAWLTERDALTTRNQELKAAATVDERRLADLTRRVDLLEAEREKLVSDKQALSEADHAKAVEVATLIAQRDGLTANKDTLSKEVKRLAGENTKLNRMNSVLTNKLEALHAQMEKKK